MERGAARGVVLPHGSGAIEGWDEGCAVECSHDCVDGALCVLSGGGDRAADAAEVLGTFKASEGAGDFLLDLGHADISLSTVIVEGHREIEHEGQNLCTIRVQPFDEV